MTGLVMGTPGYLSPEVVEGAPVTEATDWWGWAATLAFAASGAPPFGRGPMDAVLSRVSRGEPDLTGVDPRLAPLLYAALSPEPRQRPDADEVVDALERYAAGEPVTEALSQPPARDTQVLEHRATAHWERPAVAPAVWSVPVAPAAPAAPVSATPGAPAERALQPAYQPVPAQWAPPPGDLVPWDDDGAEVSEWQEAWEGQAGEPDPRIGRPQRTGTLLALLAALVAAAATFPVVAAAVALLWSWASRTADRSVTSLVLRRHTRGRRRSDVPFAVVASPWHLVAGALATLLGALLPVVVGACAVFSAALASVAVTGGSPAPDTAGPLAVGGAVTALMAWWGPGGSGLRRGSRSIVRGISPGSTATTVLAVALLLVAAGLTLWAVQHVGQPQWWPTQGPGPLPGA